MKPIDLSKLEISKTINSDNSTSVAYSILGRQLLACEIDTPIARECARLQVIVKDLELVSASLKLAQTYNSTNSSQNIIIQFDPANPEHIILSAIYRSSIITYAKHFTKADGDAPQLHDEQMKQHLDEELFQLHKKIRDMRNNWIAHGNHNEFERGKTIHIIDPSMKFGPQCFQHVLDFATPLNAVVQKFESLTNKVLEVAKDRLQQRTRKFLKAELHKMDPNELVSKHSIRVVFHYSNLNEQ
ncbi:hypothetical protein [Pseudomonas sp. R45(2017)]|uniref:hypothetical protein n=1 Tax=Pseudomonas sp. R45(2017) TaxID=1981678 RepID=UPI00111BE548|nr:hypothetical protein [Pseudomonas sp. R45(2017)]